MAAPLTRAIRQKPTDCCATAWNSQRSKQMTMQLSYVCVAFASCTFCLGLPSIRRMQDCKIATHKLYRLFLKEIQMNRSVTWLLLLSAFAHNQSTTVGSQTGFHVPRKNTMGKYKKWNTHERTTHQTTTTTNSGSGDDGSRNVAKR